MRNSLLLVRVARLAAAVVVAVGLAGYTSAETVLVDFGSNDSFRGVSVAAPDENGNYWNSLVPGPYYPDLKDINNSTTTIDLGYDTPVGTDSYNGPAGPTTFPTPTATEIAATDIDAAALGILGVKTAAIDFAAGQESGNKAARFQIQGLNSSLLYNLTFFGSHKFSTDSTTVYSIYSDATYTSVVATGSLDIQDPVSPWLHNRDKVVQLNGVAPQASDILYVEFVGSNGGQGYLNAFSITAVPEPASTLLLVGGIGLAACGLRRR